MPRHKGLNNADLRQMPRDRFEPALSSQTEQLWASMISNVKGKAEISLYLPESCRWFFSQSLMPSNPFESFMCVAKSRDQAPMCRLRDNHQSGSVIKRKRERVGHGPLSGPPMPRSTGQKSGGATVSKWPQMMNWRPERSWHFPRGTRLKAFIPT